MNRFKFLFRRFASFFPTGALSTLPASPLLLPYHHVVSDDYLPHIKNLYAYKNRKQFTDDLDWLLARFQPVHPDEARDHVLNGRQLTGRKFLLSFDDGFREVAEVVAPILLQKGVPALFFINPAFLDNRLLFYRCKLSLVLEQIKKEPALASMLRTFLKIDTKAAIRPALLRIGYAQQHLADELGQRAGIDFPKYLARHQPFLTTGQLTDLIRQGFVIGGHSIDHPNYAEISLEAQLDQTLGSIGQLEKITGRPILDFAFPHQDVSVRQAFFDEVQRRRPGTLYFGTGNGRIEKHNPVLHRFNAEDPSLPAAGLVKSVVLYNSLLQWSGRGNLLRK